jgi:hypothetical protein
MARLVKGFADKMIVPAGARDAQAFDDELPGFGIRKFYSGKASVSTDTLRRCHARQEIKIIKLSPRRVGVRLSDLRAFIAERAA